MEINTQIAVYNADEKKLVGLFQDIPIVSRYLFPFEDANKRINFIHYALKTKKKLQSKEVKGNLAIRWATTQQRELLGNKQYLIL